MALSATPTLIEINTIIGTTSQSLITCIANANRTGIWDSQLDFALWDGTSMTPFELSTTSASTALTACSQNVYNTKYHDGAGTNPALNDYVYDDVAGDTAFDGGNEWWHGEDSDRSMKISDKGYINNGPTLC